MCRLLIEDRLRFLLGRTRALLLQKGLIKEPKKPSPELHYLAIKGKTSNKNLKYFDYLGIKYSLIEESDIKNLNVAGLYLLLGSHDEAFGPLVEMRRAGLTALWSQMWLEENNNKPFWRRRVAVVEAIYSDLMTEQLEDRSNIVQENREWIDFENRIFQTYIENKEEYKRLVGCYLREGWDLTRINPITTSILLEAISEYNALKTDILILITQSVKTAKNYCDTADYKIINAILDRHFRSL